MEYDKELIKIDSHYNGHYWWHPEGRLHWQY